MAMIMENWHKINVVQHFKITDDWATQNPKVKHLLRVLQEAALYEAADYISENVLHQGKAPRLSDSTSTENFPSLPHPAWADGKKISDEKQKISSSNFNSGMEKELYNREKNMSYNELENSQNDECLGQETTYLDLVRNSEEENDYRALKSPDEEVRYLRGPSYTSGEDRSVLLEGRNRISPVAVEHLEADSVRFFLNI